MVKTLWSFQARRKPLNIYFGTLRLFDEPFKPILI